MVLDPAREGRQQPTDAICAALVKDGTLGQEAVVANVLEPCGLSRAEAAHAASYVPSGVVTFRQGNRDARISRGRANTVDAASVYVAISRAGTSAAVYTDSRASLTEALGLRDGTQIKAIDEPSVRSWAPKTPRLHPFQLSRR